VIRCAYLTLAEKLDFVIDDEHTYEPLRALGVTVEAVPWDSSADWASYDLAVLRSTWDYFLKPAEFLETLARIDRETLLLNDLETVRWNIDKSYLTDLRERGVPIVPTVVQEGFSPRLFDRLDTDELIVKPTIGANAFDTFRLRRGEAPTGYEGRKLLAQPFVETIAEGEVSMMYFDGELSHAVRKTPKPGDFRSQEEHGSDVVPIEPGPALRAAGDAVIAALDHIPLYARADLVRTPGEADAYWLMELELVEPALYFRMDTAAPRRFAGALILRTP
jgi:glutathione synthase/RimK-type ligase-like ATP-grasp enzyme